MQSVTLRMRLSQPFIFTYKPVDDIAGNVINSVPTSSTITIKDIWLLKIKNVVDESSNLTYGQRQLLMCCKEGRKEGCVV